jgi:hypothetical protein
MNAFRSCVLLATTLALPAQAPVVFPSDHATVTNGSSSVTWFPYSYGISRQMAVYESWDLGIPAGHQITRIGFRADGTTIAYGESLQLQVRMGQTDRTAQSLLNNFDNNWFGTPTTVFGPAVFAMPDLNNVLSPNPDGPIIWLTLTTPFTFDPSRNLLVEWRVFANTNGGASFSYALDVGSFLSPVVSGPLGCQHSGGQIPDLESRPTKVGGTWYNDLYQAPANQPVILFLNVGLPLTAPFSLAPLFAGIPAACTGQVSPISLFSLTQVTGSSGYELFSVPIPNDRVFNDLLLSSQAFCFDFFQPGGVAVSNGDQVQIGIDPAMTVLYHQGSATNPTGSLYQNFGVVTLFDHN